MNYWRKFFITNGTSKEGLLRYAQNTGWVFLGKFSNMFVNFIATLYIARTLGPTNYGELSYGLSFIALFSFIASLGIDSVLYREIIKYPEQKNKLLGTALGIKFVASFFTSLLTIGVAWVFSPPDVSFLIISILSATYVLHIFGIISYEFGAVVNNKPVSFLSFFVTVVVNLLKVSSIFFDKGVLYLAIIIVIETLLYAIGYIYIRHRTFGSLRQWQFDTTVAKRLLLDSWPFILTSAFAVVYARIDQVMLKNLINATEVGIYDAAVRLTELWYFIPSIIVGTLFPAIINAKKTGHSLYRKRILALFALLGLLSGLIALTVSILAGPIVKLVFGNGFILTIPVLQIYVWALIPISLGIVVQHYLLTENARMYLFLMSLAGVIFNVVGNFLLIPKYQAYGAAIATLISSCVVLFFVGCLYLLGKLLRYNVKNT
ncbi:MAG TPA: flippase [Candidatus Paceibacterota bacterium]|nr:flippase [Candidatus Paceibacterota bacterium]HMO82751.1 flippase [Candidatus Paceibacterota bacterium]